MNKKKIRKIGIPDPVVDQVEKLFYELSEYDEDDIKTLIVGIATDPTYIQNVIHDSKYDNPFSLKEKKKISAIAKRVEELKKEQCKCILCGTRFMPQEDGSTPCPNCSDEEYEYSVDRYDPKNDEWKKGK